jgi:hypothetical protein
MADITKCKSTECERRHTCYRYVSDPYHFRQSYFSESPMNEDGSCNYYWDILKLKQRIEELEKELDTYKTDGLQGLYHALNYQLVKLAEELNGEYVSFKSKNDKTFERVWKAMVDSKDVAQNLLWLKKELKVDKDEEKPHVAKNAIEHFIKK